MRRIPVWVTPLFAPVELTAIPSRATDLAAAARGQALPELALQPFVAVAFADMRHRQTITDRSRRT